MEAIVLLLALAAPGVQYGYQPRQDGSMEYIIQIEPELLDQLKAGQQITSEIPPEVEGVKRFVIRVGNGAPPRIVPPAATTVRMPPRTLPEATGSSPIQLAATDRFSAPIPDANGGLPEGVKPSAIGTPSSSSNPVLPDANGGLPEGVKPATAPSSRFSTPASAPSAIAPTPLELTPSSPPARDRNTPTPAATSSSDPRFAPPPTSPTLLGPTGPTSTSPTSTGYSTPSSPSYGTPTYSPPASTPAYGTPPSTSYNPSSYNPPASTAPAYSPPAYTPPAYTPPASTQPSYASSPSASPISSSSNSDLRAVPRRNDRLDDRDRDDRPSSSRYSSRDDDRYDDRRDSYDRDRRDSYSRRDDLDRDRIYSPSQQVMKVPEPNLAATQPGVTPVVPQAAMPATNLAAQPQTPEERPWMAFTVVGILLMLSLGVNFYLGWMVWEARMRWPDMANESNRRLRRSNAAA